MNIIEPWKWAGPGGIITLIALVFLMVVTGWVAIKKPLNGAVFLLVLSRVQAYLALLTAILFIINWPAIHILAGSNAHKAIWMLMLSQILATLIANFVIIALSVTLVSVCYQRNLRPAFLDIVGFGSGLLSVLGNVVIMSVIVYTIQN